MKNPSIFTEDDLNFKAIGWYIMKFWYILLIAIVLGGGLGWYANKAAKTTYDIQAIVSVPSAWHELSDYPEGLMYQLLTQYVTATNGAYKIAWIARPINDKGATVNSFVSVTATTKSLEDGAYSLNLLLSSFQHDQAFQSTVHQAKAKVAEKLTILGHEELSLRNDNSAKSAADYSQSLKNLIAQQQQTKLEQNQAGNISWVTAPGISAVHEKKSLLLYVGFGVLAGFSIGLLTILIPGYKKE